MEPRKRNSDKLFSKKTPRYTSNLDTPKEKPVVTEYRPVSRDQLKKPKALPRENKKNQNDLSNSDSLPDVLKTANSDKDGLSTEERMKQFGKRDKKQKIIGNSRTTKKQSQVRVQLGGMVHTITAPLDADEKYIRFIARRTNQIISQVYEQVPGMSTMNVSILALINMVDELTQNEVYTKELEEQFSKYVTANESEKENLLRLRDLNWEMRKEIQRLRAIIENYENQITGIPVNPVPVQKLPLEVLLEELGEEEISENEANT